MRDLERRIKKLEQLHCDNHQEIYALLHEADLDIFERTRILCDVGLISGEMIIHWITEGARKQ